MPSRSRLVALLVLAAVLPAMEAAVLVGLGFRAARGLASQVTAVWPYDLYHDLRWLLVYHNSWLTFALGLLAVTVVRGLLSAALTVLAWPTQVTRPSLRWFVTRNIEVAALAAMIISPWAALAVMASAVSLSWFLIASLIPMLLLSPFLQRAGVVGKWWRGLPSAELVGWTSLNFALITVAAALVWSMADWWAIPVAAVAGMGNGLLWRQTVRAAALPRRVRWQRVPVAPIAVALVLVASLAAQTRIGVTGGGEVEWWPPKERLPERVRHSVIALAGHGSSYDGGPAADPRIERFSYRGLDSRQLPLPYDRLDTYRSLDSSAALLAAQVETLHRRTGRPVALIGQSEGAMVVRTYLERWPRSQVDLVLMFSPLVRAGGAYFPPRDDSTGWGLVAGWELRVIFTLIDLTSGRQESVDEPFVRSILDDAPLYRNRTLCPVPGVRIIAFLPTITAAEAPPGEYARVPVYQVPAFHGGLLGNGVTPNRVIDFLAGESVDGARLEYGLFQRLGAAWQAPPLAISVNPAWRDARQPDPSFTGRICQQG